MVEGILVEHPEVLVHPARKILNLVTTVVELTDFTDVTQVLALDCMMVFRKWINLLSGGGFDVCCQKS